MFDLSRWGDRIACPTCKVQLPLVQPELLHCERCAVDYPINKGVPFLMSEKGRQETGVELTSELGQGMVTEYENDTKRNLFGFLPRPSSMYHKVPDWRSYHQARSAQELVLSIGGGPTRLCTDAVNLNVGAFANVDMVADTHELPFVNEGVDIVLASHVFEHLRHPFKAAAEIHRVLRPDGLLYVETPFLLGVHGYPNDYFRYTIQGLIQLFHGFRVIQTGATSGCSSAIAVLLRKYIIHLMPSALSSILDHLMAGLLLPLKYIARKGERMDGGLAQAYYLIAQKI
jgi:uncharacterized protein YbaR (Trm112 family)